LDKKFIVQEIWIN